MKNLTEWFDFAVAMRDLPEFSLTSLRTFTLSKPFTTWANAASLSKDGQLRRQTRDPLDYLLRIIGSPTESKLERIEMSLRPPIHIHRLAFADEAFAKTSNSPGSEGVVEYSVFPYLREIVFSIIDITPESIQKAVEAACPKLTKRGLFRFVAVHVSMTQPYEVDME